MENNIVKDNNIHITEFENNLSNKETRTINKDQNNSPNNITVLHSKEKNKKINYDYLFKIALIGDSSTGKTSILLRFTENDFRDDTSSTIGVDFKIMSISLGNEKFAKMQIWDTCGSERFKALTMSFIKSCPVFLLVFDITKYKSFSNLENWIKVINDNVSSKMMCLIGNKSDLSEFRQVSKEEALIFAQKYGLKYIETSAKTNHRIEDAFVNVCESLLDELNMKKNSYNNLPINNTFEIGGFRNLLNQKEEGNKTQQYSNSCC
jgi:small GTP-binding protein